ncbi:MAG: hypothetical protein ACM3SW_01655 [Actinomycetota bacterium]
MSTANAVMLALSVALEAWLARLLILRDIRRHFPIFYTYTMYLLLVAAGRLAAVISYRAYFYVYWWTDPLIMLLGLAGVHEVFRWVYEGFYELRWFRRLYFGVIALVLLLTVWNALSNPPIQAHPVIGLLVDISIAVNLIQACIVAFFSAFIRPLGIDFRRYAFGIAAGFGVSSIGPFVGYFARSVFGTEANNFTSYSSSVAYILALLIWIAAFSRPEPEEQAWTPPMAPDEMLRTLEAYLRGLGIKEKTRKGESDER